MKKKKKSNDKLSLIIECLLVFIVIFIYNSFFDQTQDKLIDFTHSYSIVKGLIPYKDFNMVVGPVYPAIMAFFLWIFGNNCLVFNVVNSLAVLLIYLIIRHHNKRTIAFFFIVLFQAFLIAKYNTFIMIFLYLLYYLEKGNIKHKDYLIGFILALTVFTKIHVGAFLILPTLILHYKEPKVILKRFISFMITSLIIFLILILLNCFKEFLNYTVFGLFDFGGSTATKQCLSKYYYLIIVLVIVIIVNTIEMKENKEILYFTCFLILALPLIEPIHVAEAVFPTVVYYGDKIKYSDKMRVLFLLVSYIFAVIIFVSLARNNTFKYFGTKYYLSNNGPTNTALEIVHKENKKLPKGYKYYYFLEEAYFFKHDLKENITKYDFIWEGNIGYNGEEQYIKEINKDCKKNKCVFITNMQSFTSIQISPKLIKYVTDNYKKVDTNSSYIFVFTNEEDFESKVNK